MFHHHKIYVQLHVGYKHPRTYSTHYYNTVTSVSDALGVEYFLENVISAALTRRRLVVSVKRSKTKLIHHSDRLKRNSKLIRNFMVRRETIIMWNGVGSIIQEL